MDLLACSECARRFYAPGVSASDNRRCPQCGGGLALTAQGMAAIPLDARWLDPGLVPGFEVTVVELRRKRERGGRTEERIVRDLADYFPVEASGGSVQVSVNRGAAADAALRVAAILDGVDGGWEEHFFLPTSHSGVSEDDSPPPSTRARRHLHLVSQAEESLKGEL